MENINTEEQKEKHSEIKTYLQEQKQEILEALTKKKEIRYGTVKSDLQLLFGMKQD